MFAAAAQILPPRSHFHPLSGFPVSIRWSTHQSTAPGLDFVLARLASMSALGSPFPYQGFIVA
jgi:hypothetical protein